MIDGIFVQDQFVRLMLREIPDPQPGAAPDLSPQRIETPGQKFRERGLAVAVRAEQRDAIVHVDDE